MFLKALIFYILGISTQYVTLASVFATAVDIPYPSPCLLLVSPSYSLSQFRVLVIYLLKVARFYILPLWLVLKLLRFK